MILGIIPARCNSQGIPDKNIYPLCGKPLIEYTIDAAQKSNLDDWFVFTDRYTQYRTYDIRRPDEYSQGEYNSVVSWLPYAIAQYEIEKQVTVDAVMLLQPTSPLRAYYDINYALDKFNDTGSSCLCSGYYMRIKKKIKPDSKYTAEPHFQRNGAMFLFKVGMIKTGMLWDDSVYEYEMPYSRSIDIDTMEDMWIAEALLESGVLHWKL